MDRCYHLLLKCHKSIYQPCVLKGNNHTSGDMPVGKKLGVMFFQKIVGALRPDEQSCKIIDTPGRCMGHKNIKVPALTDFR